MVFTSRTLSLLLVLYIFLILNGCGGGGSSSSGSSSPENTEDNEGAVSVLTAHAGSDLTVFVETEIELNASASISDQHRELSYSWVLLEKPSESSAEESIHSPENVTTNFTPDLPGAYRLQVTVSAAHPQETATDDLTVLAKSSLDSIGGSFPVDPTPPADGSDPAPSPEETDPDLSARFSTSLLNTTLDGQVRAIISTEESGLAAAAATDDGIHFIKIKQSGAIEWQKTFGDIGDIPLVIKEESGRFIIFGVREFYDTQDGIIFMTPLSASSDVDLTFFDSFGERQHLNSARRMNDGGYLLAGNANDRMLFAKIDTDGGVEDWSPAAGTGIDALEHDGDFIFLGDNKDKNIELFRMRSGFSTPVWNKTFGGAGSDLSRTMGKTDQGFLIVGSTNSPAVSANDTDYDIFVIRTDFNGNTEEDLSLDFPGQIIGEPDNHEFVMAMTAHPGSDTGFTLIGAAEKNSDNFDIYLARVDFDDDTSYRWQRIFGENQDDLGLFVMPLDDNELRIGGLAHGNMRDFRSPSNFSFSGKLWLAHTNSEGNTAPSSTQIADMTLPSNSQGSLDLSLFFKDIGGDPLTFSATGLPQGLSINADTGKVTGTAPRVASDTRYEGIKITATDDGGLNTSETFTLTILAE